MMRRFNNIDREKLQTIVDESTSYSEVLRKLGLKDKGANHTDIKKYLNENGFDVKTLVGRSIYRGPKHIKQKTLFEILVKGDSYKNSNKLRQRLIRNGIKEEKCEKCGITEWNGEKIVFELHHINGDHYDNRLENIVFLCPNCHSQTHNFCGKNSTADEEKQRYNKLIEIAKKDSEVKLPLLVKEYEEVKKEKSLAAYNNKKRSKKVEILPKRYCKVCDKEIENKHNKQYCSVECFNLDKSRKILSKERLLEISKESHSLSEMRRKINSSISDNAIKKWCDKYNIYEEVKNNFLQRSYPIDQYDMDGKLIKTWKDGNEISLVLGYNKSKIQGCCNGKQKSSYGYIWRYKE